MITLKTHYFFFLNFLDSWIKTFSNLLFLLGNIRETYCYQMFVYLVVFLNLSEEVVYTATLVHMYYHQYSLQLYLYWNHNNQVFECINLYLLQFKVTSTDEITKSFSCQNCFSSWKLRPLPVLCIQLMSAIQTLFYVNVSPLFLTDLYIDISIHLQNVSGIKKCLCTPLNLPLTWDNGVKTKSTKLYTKTSISCCSCQIHHEYVKPLAISITDE